MAARRPIPGFIDTATNKATNPAEWAAMVYVSTNANNEVNKPAAARAQRFAGVLTVGSVSGKYPDADVQISLQKTRRGYSRLVAPGAGATSLCTPGDYAVIANSAGDTTPYVLGTGTVEYIGRYTTYYNNQQSSSIEVETEIMPGMIIQAHEVKGFLRAITANNTKYIGWDGTELTADESLFVAPWNGTLQGPLRVDVEASGGTPAGSITVKVRIKVPGGSWATAQVGSTPADWATVLAASGSVTSADDVTNALPFGNSLAIVKGTKVGFQVIKDSSVANVAQLNVRLAFL